MREITYKCDKCGKKVLSKYVTKINMNKQKGSGQVEKMTYDFCTSCFVHMKNALQIALKSDDDNTGYTEPIKTDQMPMKAEPANSDNNSSDGQKIAQTDPISSEDKANSDFNNSSDEQKQLKLGPISPEEKAEILRLHIQEKLDPDQIAARMNRLPRGIKRAINSATKSGELDILRSNFENEKSNVTSKEIIEEDGSSGSGVSDSGIKRDEYLSDPTREVINGKRYDVGGILALAKAGWTVDDISEERNYDKDIVSMIVEKYL